MPRSLLIAGLFAFAASMAVAAEPSPQRERAARSEPAGTLVEIETTSGRKLVGHLDPDSDTRTVYLRSERPGIVLTTKVPGSTIRRIGPYDGSKVLRIEGPSITQRESRGPSALPAPPSVPLLQTSAISGPVQSLRVEAWPENWDRDAALDGLRLLVTPVTAQGTPVAARGTLTVQLIARRFSGVREDDTVSVVEEWSRQLSPSDFGPNGATVDLPFRKLDPERDLDVIPVGLLQARLGISGQGSFQAPATEFWLRPTSYLRDELQLHTGSRLLPR